MPATITEISEHTDFIDTLDVDVMTRIDGADLGVVGELLPLSLVEHGRVRALGLERWQWGMGRDGMPADLSAAAGHEHRQQDAQNSHHGAHQDLSRQLRAASAKLAMNSRWALLKTPL